MHIWTHTSGCGPRSGLGTATFVWARGHTVARNLEEKEQTSENWSAHAPPHNEAHHELRQGVVEACMASAWPAGRPMGFRVIFAASCV